MGIARGAAYLFQIPLERGWPGEPFLLFFLVVIGTALCFGARLGLTSAALSTFDGRCTTGMGEDLVRGLCCQLGGDLRVKSSKTGGSTFRLYIPHQSPVMQQSVTVSRG